MYSNTELSVFKLFLMMSDSPNYSCFHVHFPIFYKKKDQHNQKPAKPTPKSVCNMGEKKEPVLPWLYAQELTSPVLSWRRHPVFKLTSMKIKHNAKTGFSFPLSHV